MHRGADGGGAVRNHAHFHIAGQGLLQHGQQAGHAVGHVDDVGSGLALHREHYGRAKGVFAVRARRGHIGGQARVFRAVQHVGHILEAQRRAVLVTDDGPGIFLRRGELVVGVNGAGPLRPVKTALGVVDVGRGNGRAHVGQGQARPGQGLGIDLHAHGRALPAGQRDQAHAGQLRNLLGQTGVHQVFQAGQGHGVAGHGQGDDGRVRRIDLVVDRRIGQVVGQQVVRRVDGRLHFLLGHVQGDGKVELQGDDRGPGRGQGTHLHQAGHDPELAFQRGRDHRRDDVRRRAGIEGLHLNGGVVDLRQGRHRQGTVGQQAREQQGHHQQGGGDGTENEDAGEVHGIGTLPRPQGERGLSLGQYFLCPSGTGVLRLPAFGPPIVAVFSRRRACEPCG